MIFDPAILVAAAVAASGGVLGGLLTALSLYSHRNGLDPFGTWCGPAEPKN